MKHKKIHLWTLLADALFLFLALVSVAFGAVTAYHMEVVPSALWIGAAALTLTMVGLMNLPKYRFPATAGVLALWAWGLWRLWKPLVWGGTRIQCDVVNLIASKIPNVTGIVPVIELSDELWIQVTTLWLLMVGVVYALVLALLLCRLRRALPVLLWTLLPILPALCVTEAPDPLPAAGLLAVWLTLVLTSLTDSRDPSGAARQRLGSLLCVLLALSLLAQRLPVQGTAQPLWAADIREALINGASRGDFSALLSRWSGWVGAGSTEYMNLLGSAPARTGRTALRVTASQGGKYYLRGYSADIYTGRRWEPLGREAKEELEAIRETGMEPLLILGERARESTDYDYVSYQNGERISIKGENSATLTVENVAAPGGCIYYPYGLVQLPENATFGGDSHLERTGAVWEHTFAFYPEWERVSWYKGEESGPYYDFVYAHQLQVPDDLRPILEDWLRQATGEAMGEYGLAFANLEEYVRYAKGYDLWRERISGQLYELYQTLARSGNWDETYYQSLADDLRNSGPTPEDFERAQITPEDLEEYRDWYVSMMTGVMINYLAQTTRYDRDTPAPPAGRDYVDWFLNESKQGYCMHYATAATLLLRAAGIPARYVSGYVANIPWRTNTVEVTDHAAHAWVEVYIDGVGWYPLEVTPGFQSNAMGDIPDLESGNAQATVAPTAAPSPTPSPTPSAAPSPTPSVPPSAAPTPSQAPGEQTGPGSGEGKGLSLPSGVWYALGAALLLVLSLRGRKYVLSRRREKLRGEDTNAAVLYAYRCYEGLKPWGGVENEELTALAERAKFSQHTLTPAQRDRGAELFREEARRVYGVLPAWKKPLFTLLWGK